MFGCDRLSNASNLFFVYLRRRCIRKVFLSEITVHRSALIAEWLQVFLPSTWFLELIWRIVWTIYIVNFRFLLLALATTFACIFPIVIAWFARIVIVLRLIKNLASLSSFLLLCTFVLMKVPFILPYDIFSHLLLDVFFDCTLVQKSALDFLVLCCLDSWLDVISSWAFPTLYKIIHLLNRLQQELHLGQHFLIILRGVLIVQEFAIINPIQCKLHIIYYDFIICCCFYNIL